MLPEPAPTPNPYTSFAQFSPPAPLFAPTQVSGVNVAKFMHKPSAFSGLPSEDVDNALYAIEMYLHTTRIPTDTWPTIATTMVKGEAFRAWMSLVVPLRRSGVEPTWDHFTKCMRDAFSPPDKELNARKAFRALRQKHFSVLEYVRHARALLAQLVNSPPSEADKTVALFEGLNQSVKQAAPVNPRTGRAWQTFDELAEHIITLEAQVPQKLQSDRLTDAFARKPNRMSKAMPRVAFAAPFQASRQPRPTRDPRPYAGIKPVSVPGGPSSSVGPSRGGKPDLQQHKRLRPDQLQQKQQGRSMRAQVMDLQHSLAQQGAQLAALQQSKK